MKRRKSEVLIVKDNRKGCNDVFEVVRVPVNLPWDIREKIMGYCASNVIIDITGALKELEEFKRLLVGIKDSTDAIKGRMLVE